MPRRSIIKIAAWSFATLLMLSILGVVGFVYKIKNGFPVSYETDMPEITFPENRKNVLLFSKSTGFHHGESIAAGKEAFAEIAQKNHWFLYDTEEGGVFNDAQLNKFEVVIFNNCTGRLLNKDQQLALEKFVQQGGTFLGIHGAGDDSHHWPWYEENLIGVRFSHHAFSPQVQKAEVLLNEVPDTLLTQRLPYRWTNVDEWYVFFENPRAKGFEVLYNIDGETIVTNGNVLWINDKNFGMGKDHPVAWYKRVGEGRTFYTSMGHDKGAWQQDAFLQMLENVVAWE